ncbi:MAG: hypothetical protein R3B37_16265 [Nitrospira sp.]|nr:hypothetical protein [Nitrospira sp.]
MRNHPFLKIIDNRQKTTPAALNLGISLAKASIIIRMDAHSLYDKFYISRCVEALGKYSADCVGGIWKILPRTKTLFGYGVAQALSHPFGVGNARYRYAEGDEPQWVDTVPYFCMRKWKVNETGVFNESLIRGEDMEFHLRLSQVGTFNEKLRRGQDMEFSLRLKRAGGRTLLMPSIVSYYYARSDVRSFWRHSWENGVWAILPFAYSDIVPVAGRHLVPLVFVGACLGFFILGLWFGFFLGLAGAILAAYGLVALAASIHIAWRKRQARYCVIMPVVFGMLHTAYGLGSLLGHRPFAGFWCRPEELRNGGLSHAAGR